MPTSDSDAPPSRRSEMFAAFQRMGAAYYRDDVWPGWNNAPDSVLEAALTLADYLSRPPLHDVTPPRDVLAAYREVLAWGSNAFGDQHTDDPELVTRTVRYLPSVDRLEELAIPGHVVLHHLACVSHRPRFPSARLVAPYDSNRGFALNVPDAWTTTEIPGVGHVREIAGPRTTRACAATVLHALRSASERLGVSERDLLRLVRLASEAGLA